MHASFNVRTAKDYLEKFVHQSQKDWLADEQASTSTGRAIAAAIFCWHLHDWVWAQHIKKNTKLKEELAVENRDAWRDSLKKERKEFEALEQIANGSKHVGVGRNVKEPIKTGRGFMDESLVGPDPKWVDMSLNVDVQGTNVLFKDILTCCVEYWDKFFQEHLQGETNVPRTGPEIHS